MYRYVFRKVPEGEMQGGCGFIDGRKRAAVGLVSFPGSGDTWLRQLLETATGICTGTVTVFVCVYFYMYM